MYNVVVFCGGTGSIALQKGFSELINKGTMRFHYIINAYDNGLSTGECRRVFKGKILGPSDLRKNHLTQYQIYYSEKLKDSTSKESRLYEFMSLRFSAENYLEYFEKARRKIKEQDYLDASTMSRLIFLLDYFFTDRYDGNTEDSNIQYSYRETVKNVKFVDFSLSNIFYASSAVLNGYSLSKAGTEMAALLGIENNVLLISDVSLFLHAKTEAGTWIDDEGDIIRWNNSRNRITEAILTDTEGKEYIPQVNEGIKDYDVAEIIRNADILILSSGTQWSSLIPTYMHRGFQDLVNGSYAKKYMVMNNVEDGDMFGIDADLLYSTVNRFVDLSSFRVVINKNAPDSLNKMSSTNNTLCGVYSTKNAKRHEPVWLASAIMTDFYGQEAMSKDEFMFDLDGTLWNEKEDGFGKSIGEINLSLFPGKIVSGNSYEHLIHVLGEHCKQKRDIAVYCNYGNTYYLSSRAKEICRLTDLYDVGEDVLELVNDCEEYKGKCRIRGGVILTIKPLEDRESHCRKLNALLEKYGGKYIARIAGNTTIDITQTDFSKAKMVEMILEREKIDAERVLFVGNEVYQGNEMGIAEKGVSVLQVNDVYECNVFLNILGYVGKWNK